MICLELKNVRAGMFLPSVKVLFSSLVLSSAVSAQALYSPPVNKVGGALAEGVTQTLIRRGFAANDPRIYQTIRAVGSRVLPLASAAGSGANWLGLAARLSPWVTAGVLVYTGVKWYFDNQGNVFGANALGGVVLGGECFFVYGTSFCTGSPEQALIWYAINYTSWIDVTGVILTLVSSSGSGLRYLGEFGGHQPGSGLLPVKNYNSFPIYAGVASATCPGGQGALNGTCVPAPMDKYSSSGSSSPKTLQTAYDALPQAAKDGALSPELAAELANRLWRDAAVQPGYDGVPWSGDVPVNGPDFLPVQAAHPSDWPVTSALNDVVPTSVSPVQSSYVNPNQVNSPSGSTKVDLGPDPGVQAPNLESPPTNLFKPISDLLAPWLTWTVPNHSGVCPTFQASPSIAGRVFNVDLSSHCAFVEPYKSTILAASLVCWAVIAVFIILAA
jgi:hypothetical protein